MAWHGMVWYGVLVPHHIVSHVARCLLQNCRADFFYNLCVKWSLGHRKMLLAKKRKNNRCRECGRAHVSRKVLHPTSLRHTLTNRMGSSSFLKIFLRFHFCGQDRHVPMGNYHQMTLLLSPPPTSPWEDCVLAPKFYLSTTTKIVTRGKFFFGSCALSRQKIVAKGRPRGQQCASIETAEGGQRGSVCRARPLHATYPLLLPKMSPQVYYYPSPRVDQRLLLAHQMKQQTIRAQH